MYVKSCFIQTLGFCMFGCLFGVKPKLGTRTGYTNLSGGSSNKLGVTFSKGPCVSRHCHPEFGMHTGRNCGFFDVFLLRLVRIRR